jgi:hypothetical protein
MIKLKLSLQVCTRDLTEQSSSAYSQGKEGETACVCHRDAVDLVQQRTAWRQTGPIATRPGKRRHDHDASPAIVWSPCPKSINSATRAVSYGLEHTCQASGRASGIAQRSRVHSHMVFAYHRKVTRGYQHLQTLKHASRHDELSVRSRSARAGFCSSVREAPTTSSYSRRSRAEAVPKSVHFAAA